MRLMLVIGAVSVVGAAVLRALLARREDAVGADWLAEDARRRAALGWEGPAWNWDGWLADRRDAA